MMEIHALIASDQGKGNIMQIRGHHMRASEGSRATNVVKISAFRPAARAREDASTDSHHSAGILSRCHHLETTQACAPISEASASRVGHSSITDLNEVIWLMTKNLGQPVLKSKAILSLDCDRPPAVALGMPTKDSEDQYKQSFRSRTKQARQSCGYKQWEVALALDMEQDKYKQYETRSLLPHHLIARFAAFCRVDVNWLLTGHGKMGQKAPPRPIPVEEPAQPQPVLKPKRRRPAA